MQALEQAIAAEPSPVILIAHSLGCITVAHWARAAGVAAAGEGRCWWRLRTSSGPPVRRPRNFAPIPLGVLPFPSQVVSSDNDPAVSVPRAYLAQAWGAGGC